MIIIPQPVQDSLYCISNITNHNVTLCVDVQSACLKSIKMCWTQTGGKKRRRNPVHEVNWDLRFQILPHLQFCPLPHFKKLSTTLILSNEFIFWSFWNTFDPKFLDHNWKQVAAKYNQSTVSATELYLFLKLILPCFTICTSYVCTVENWKSLLLYHHMVVFKEKFCMKFLNQHFDSIIHNFISSSLFMCNSNYLQTWKKKKKIHLSKCNRPCPVLQYACMHMHVVHLSMHTVLPYVPTRQMFSSLPQKGGNQ